MKKGNILVIGNSGVGKSTLINAVLGDNVAYTEYGTHGTTVKLSIYENDSVPFRVIDTIGFVPGFFKNGQAIRAVKKWGEDCAKIGKEDTSINVIWFCVDGTSSKLFQETIDNFSKATAMWPSVPILVVITKSYSDPDREENIKMVKDAFTQHKRFSKNRKPRKIIPVVAKTYVIRSDVYAPPYGINELIEATNEMLPEGVRAAQNDLSAFKLSRKRALSHSVVGVATTGAAVVGAVPIPIPDAAILTPAEVAEVNAIAHIYEVKNTEESNQLINSIIQAGTVGVAAKGLLNTIKAIPGVNIAASVLNAVVAASIATVIGESSIYIFEQVYLGKKTVQDIDWVKKVIESKLTNEILENIKVVIQNIGTSENKHLIAKAVLDSFDSN